MVVMSLPPSHSEESYKPLVSGNAAYRGIVFFFFLTILAIKNLILLAD